MIKPDYAIYLAEDTDKIHTDILTNDSFYIVVTTDAGVGKEHIREALDKTKDSLLDSKPRRLDGFEAQIDKLENAIGERMNFALAASLVVGNILYLVTRGRGVIYIKRNQTFKKIISKDNVASGHIQEGDNIILTTEKLTDLISEEELNNRIGKNKPKDVVDDITIHFKKQRDEGLIMFLLNFTSEHKMSVGKDQEEKYRVYNRPSIEKETKGVQDISTYFTNYTNLFLKIVKGRKRIALVASIVIFAILLWSVVFGYQRRARQQVIDKVAVSSETVQQKLNEAEEIAPLDLSQALEKIKEAKKEVADVENFAKSKNLSDLEELKDLKRRVSEKEKAVQKKEDKKFIEYYDLALIADNASGTDIYLYGDIIEILDADTGKIYSLSSETKSTDTFADSKIKNADMIAAYLDKLYFLDANKGIYEKKPDEEKANLVVGNDKWGNVVDFWIYNGNIYLLDSGADEIYKYLVAESGFSKKASYFKKGQSIDLSSATSMSIDGAIYIASKDKVYKYISGIRQEFGLNLPEKINIKQVFTSKDLDSLYLWDKNAGKVVVVSKEGEYKKQITSSIIKKAKRLIVLPDETILVLYKNKLFKIE